MSVDATIALVSLADAKEYLKIAGAGDDTILEKLINRASASFEKKAGRPLIQKVRYEYYNGNGDCDLILRCHPISAVASLYNADANRNFDATTLIDVTNNVIVQNHPGIITLWNDESKFLHGQANVKVIYTAGWKVSDATYPVPYDVQDAIHKWVAQMYFKYDKRRHERLSVQKGDISETYIDEEVPKEVARIIKNNKDYLGAPHFCYEGAS